MEIFSGAPDTWNYEWMYPVRHSIVWGCPTYVLDPFLRDGGKVTRCQTMSR